MLAFTNDIFYQIMKRNLGGVDYTDEAALYCGADYPAGEKEDAFDSEILLTTTQELEEGTKQQISKQELEAKLIADRIRKMVGKEEVVDEETGEFRKVHYGDIVILLRSLSEWADLFAEVLNANGIPAHTVSRTGYFSTLEIRTVLNYLRILDNPRQDIPLAAVPTVDALAYNLYGCEQLICPMMDARRQQVYTGLYGFSSIEQGTEFQVIEPQCATGVEEIIKKINERGQQVVYLGDGATVYETLIKEQTKVPYVFAPANCNRQSAAALAVLAKSYYERGEYVTAAEHRPDYLRLSQAERERMEKMQK